MVRTRYAGGIERLTFYLSRFRDAIEADLAFRGISLNQLFVERKWRLLLNLINHLPPNSHFNEVLTGDKEVMMAMHQLREARQEEQPEGEEKPLGPRVSQVSETDRRLGELITEVRRLGAYILVASPKSKASKPQPVKPYPSPVMRDGETGDWIGRKARSTLKREHEKRLSKAQEAARRWEAAQQSSSSN